MAVEGTLRRSKVSTPFLNGHCFLTHSTNLSQTFAPAIKEMPGCGRSLGRVSMGYPGPYRLHFIADGVSVRALGCFSVLVFFEKKCSEENR